MYLRITGGTDNRRQISDWPRYTHKGDRSHKGWYMEKEWEYERDEKIVLIIYPIIDFFHRAEWSFSQSGETMNRRQGRGLNGATIFFFDSLFIFFFSFPPPPFFPVPRGEIRVAFREMRLYRMITLSTTTSSARTIIASQQDLDLFRRDRGAYTIFYRN